MDAGVQMSLCKADFRSVGCIPSSGLTRACGGWLPGWESGMGMKYQFCKLSIS